MNQTKLKPAFSLPTASRCAHRTPSGRQCRLLASNLGSGLCPHHHAEFEQLQNADVYPSLSRGCQDFQTAQGINHSLHNLYWLLATNRISARRAAILAYISSLQLRTLPAIDADLKAGITDPTAGPAPAAEPYSHTDTSSASPEPVPTVEPYGRPASPDGGASTDKPPDSDASATPEPVLTSEPSK